MSTEPPQSLTAAMFGCSASASKVAVSSCAPVRYGMSYRMSGAGASTPASGRSPSRARRRRTWSW
ncbi:Uncharacterised protein [Bordetella pertussis]|nr:Uncharacterised protein [Bordetella pertussis]